MRTRIVLVALLLAAAGCRSSEQRAAPTPTAPAVLGLDAAAPPAPAALPALRPLDESTAAAFRATFDELAAHRRYIVALSPT